MALVITHPTTPPQRKPRLRPAERGQALVLFVLFLLVLLGVSALGIDYANWLLTDRRLQNVADHVALAGASAFDRRDPAAVFTCASNPAKCGNAREQAWTAFSQELDLGLSKAQVVCLADAGNTPAVGWESTDDASCSGNVEFHHTLWVSTPPPANASYTGLGGRYPRMYGIVFARVDEPTRSFLGGALGIVPGDRTGWATAGSLPADFALEVFCRNNIAPQTGVCVNSAGLTIDGQGGIRLLRGDIGINESLRVTANTGSGVILKSGNVYLVNGVCHPSTWNCAQVPANTGGIANDDPNADPNVAVGLSALPMAPLPVPKYANPLGDGTSTSITAVSNPTCLGASASVPCVPIRPYLANGSRDPAPGDWTCGGVAATDQYCGVPTVLSPGVVRCDAAAGDPDLTPPMIPPGYYRQIILGNSQCAILDPTAEHSGGLYPYQRAGVYRFGDPDTNQNNRKKIVLGNDSYLIGDGVTLVFNSDWPSPGGNQGIVLGSPSALVLNTMRVPGSVPCTFDSESTSVNMSSPLSPLPYSAVCAAWSVDPSDSAVHPGAPAWPACTGTPPCTVDRSAYDPHVPSDPAASLWRGITFYFIPRNNAWPPPTVLNRFEMPGSGGNGGPGIAFRGVMYAPYDDVKITGGNGFDTVGQVLAWSAKFNGGSAYIDLDYPYDYQGTTPSLLEPTIGQ